MTVTHMRTLGTVLLTAARKRSPLDLDSLREREREKERKKDRDRDRETLWAFSRLEIGARDIIDNMNYHIILSCEYI